MTENYKKRLIELAKKTLKEASETTFANYQVKFVEKFNHLIGYILALEENKLRLK